MKNINIFLFMLFLTSASYAGSNVCERAWPNSKQSCQLIWSDEKGQARGLEIAYFEASCFIHEGDDAVNCLQVRDCRSANSEHERYIYFEQAKIDYLCAQDGEVEIYSNKDLLGAKAFVICKSGKPEKIILQSPVSKKECSFYNGMKVRP